MLFGSRSAFPPAPEPSAEPVTPPPAAPPVCAPLDDPGVEPAALRSSTGASVVGVLEQSGSGRSEQRHHPLDGVGALLAERDVVFARAALVGIALHRQPGVAVLLQIARVRFAR